MRVAYVVAIATSAVLLSACQGATSGLGLPTAQLLNPQVQSFNDTHFEMKSCSISPERTAVCTLAVTNRFRDKRIEVDRRITIQDDLGTDYAVSAGGFGDTPNRPQWNQVAIADSSYALTVIATNLSTRATSVRAVVFPRLLVRSTQGQTMGYRDRVIFSRPTMVAHRPPTLPPSTPGPAVAPPSAPIARPDAGAWQVVGYWNYDGADGAHLATQGLVLRSVSGAGLGQQWPAHLELKNHASLPPRNRSLWPVKIHPKQRRVCADYPGYPSYPAFIDMPGESDDGIYSISMCKGE